MTEETAIIPFEFHEGPPALTPDELGAGWPYPKDGLEKNPGRSTQEKDRHEPESR